MDFKQLEAYVRVIELDSFSKAAEALYLSQPSESLYISALEKDLQTQLLYRSTKEIVPTKAGLLFYEHAKNMLALRDQSVLSLKYVTGNTDGEINILASSVPAQFILPEALAAFHEAYPKVVFRLEQTDTAEVVNGIAAQKGEVGFAGARIKNPKCVYQSFMTEKLILIAPNQERFRSLRTDDAAQLFLNEPFITREQGSGTRRRYEEFLKEVGVQPDKLRTVARFNNTQSVLHAVACGLGVSIVSELAARHYLSQEMVLSLDMPCPLPLRDFYIVTKKNVPAPPVVEVFLGFLQSHMPL
jgi:DNA-binding transcriptional LysR family regulator